MHCILRRAVRTAMSTISGTASSSTHMERTKDSTRSDVVSDVVVTDTHKLSPTVKGFTLRVENTLLNFKPGQWVDLRIPSEEIVGGYSFTSTPHQLREMGTFDLAIQSSDHPPTLWMCTKCQVGDRLSIRVGGDFTYAPPTEDNLADLLLIAGGVGINPLFSMLQHHAYIQSSVQRSKCKAHVHLLYSAKSKEELVFKDCIDEIVGQSDGMIKATYFVTNMESTNPIVGAKRMTEDDIKRALSVLDDSMLQCYICGPPPMTEDIERIVSNCGVDSTKVHCEKWW